MMGQHRASPPRSQGAPSSVVQFDPQKAAAELYDSLAEQQAETLEVNNSQLRRFFGEVKDLYRQFKALTAATNDSARRQEIYVRQIEPRFKMIRSKAAYASGRRTINASFAQFLQTGIDRVKDDKQFEKFVIHFEAVVGFMYGKDKVK